MKKIFTILLTSALFFCFTGCGNRDVFDTVYTYDKAIMELPNGEVLEIDIKQWKTYSDGEQIQVISEDGKIYLTNSFNCTLVNTNTKSNKNGKEE